MTVGINQTWQKVPAFSIVFFLCASVSIETYNHSGKNVYIGIEYLFIAYINDFCVSDYDVALTFPCCCINKFFCKFPVHLFLQH